DAGSGEIEIEMDRLSRRRGRSSGPSQPIDDHEISSVIAAGAGLGFQGTKPPESHVAFGAAVERPVVYGRDGLEEWVGVAVEVVHAVVVYRIRPFEHLHVGAVQAHQRRSDVAALAVGFGLEKELRGRLSLGTVAVE